MDKKQMKESPAYRRVGKAYLAARREKDYIEEKINGASFGDPSASYPGTGSRKKQCESYFRPFVNYVGPKAVWPLKNMLGKLSRGQIGETEQAEIINGTHERFNEARKCLASFIRLRRLSERKDLSPRIALGEGGLYGMSQERGDEIKGGGVPIYMDSQFSEIFVDKFYAPALQVAINNSPDPFQTLRLYNEKGLMV